MTVRSITGRAVAWAVLLGLSGCERGCARAWLADRGFGPATPSSPGPMPLDALDCPDGLARCEEGVVAVSRVATLPMMPCQGAPGACACPWEPAGTCGSGCAAEGVELVIDQVGALRQLCAPAADAGVFAVLPSSTSDARRAPSASSTIGPSGAPIIAPSASPNGMEPPCDEGARYRCEGGRVADCASGRALAQCVRGCFAEGASIDDDAVSREMAFAILCSR